MTYFVLMILTARSMECENKQTNTGFSIFLPLYAMSCTTFCPSKSMDTSILQTEVITRNRTAYLQYILFTDIKQCP